MLIIPAIDLEAGCVVRYVQGKRDKKIYSRSPLKAAKHWASQGAKFIHIVDLDGAFSGEPKNLDSVSQIAQNTDVPVELGGGIRSIEAIRKALGLGVSRVVLGTRAIKDRAFLEKAFKVFGNKIIVSIDAKEGQVMVEGWKASHKKMDASDFALALKALGFREVIYTDTLKDGTLSGPNIKGIKKLLKDSGLKVIASGGVSSLEDIYKLKKLEKAGVSGVIIGKALYEGKFTLKEAVKIA